MTFLVISLLPLLRMSSSMVFLVQPSLIREGCDRVIRYHQCSLSYWWTCWATWFLMPERTACCSPLCSRALHHRISIYADDVVLFLRPLASDIDLSLDVLNLFGEASGLKTNVQKSNVFPVQGSENDMTFVQDHLSCELLNFPCQYLRFLLSLRKLTKAQLQPIN